MSAEEVTLGFKADLNMASFMQKLQSVLEVKFYFNSIKRMHNLLDI